MSFHSGHRRKAIIILFLQQFLISILTVEVSTDESIPANIQLPTFVDVSIDFYSDGFQFPVFGTYGPSGYLLPGEKILFIKLSINTPNLYRGPPPVNLFNI